MMQLTAGVGKAPVINCTLSDKYPYLYQGDKPADFEVYDGWVPLCAETFRKIVELYKENGIDLSRFCVLQVKEKFGGLRIYTTGPPQQVWTYVGRIIADAEKRSFEICEMCGAPGILRHNSWWQTLCDYHNIGKESKI